MKRIFLNFDFYGAGNTGDDLMLDGFLKGLSKKHNLYCSIPRDIDHQKLRFPEIKFVKKEARQETADQCDIWIGVGDTPIQVRSGEWFLSKLLKDAESIKGKDKQYYFLGVGAEIDSIEYKEKFKKALEDVKHFWTRDITTYDILIEEFKIKTDKVSISADLANISLKRMFNDLNSKGERKYDIGICYYDELMKDKDASDIKKIILSNKKYRKTCLLFGNEVKEEGHFEYALYKKMFSKFEMLLNRNIKIYKPDYLNAVTTKELFSHYPECNYIISSRYHALLSAAWAGCKVISLERSSKASKLASDLDIVEIRKPFTLKKFYTAMKEAKPVDRKKLESFYDAAMLSVTELEARISKFKVKVDI